MQTVRYAHLISHTHWDREWYLNSRYTNEWLVPFFDALFAMLEREPRYRFVLDGQTSMIEDCCEQLEQRGRDVAAFRQALKQYAGERRLLVGPYYLQPDWQLVGEEALVRNLLIGRQVAQEYGTPLRAGWLLDNFGQISQAPQIHREFGLNGIYVWRGVEMDPAAVRSEFLWASPDGTSLLTVYMLGSYRNAMRLAEYHACMRDRIESEVEKLAPFAATPHILLMNGYDQEMAPDDILPHIRDGGMDSTGVRVVQSTPEEYLEAVSQKRPALPTLRGALYSGRFIAVFPGALSSRMYLKRENDRAQRLLDTVAEPLATVVWAWGGEYPSEELLRNWKLLLKNHPHDSICGVSIDDVHADMENRLAECVALSETSIRRSLSTWAANVDTSRHPNAVSRWIAVNSTLREREEVVALNADLRDAVLVDGRGDLVPVQNGGPVTLAAPRVPALGYSVLYAVPRAACTPAPPEDSVRCDVRQHTLENEFLSVAIALNGSVTLVDKRTGASYSGLAVIEDGGDAGDEYNYSPPSRDQVITSRTCRAQIEFVETGPLRARAEIALVLNVPEGLTPQGDGRSPQTRALPVVTRVTLERHSPILAFHTEIRNTVKDHRLRVLFPTGIVSAVSHAETQFDVVTHPVDPVPYDDSTIPPNVKDIILGAREPLPATSFPQRSFVDLDDGTRGLAVLNRGLPEYEILREGNTIALTLFRGVNWIARPDLATRIGDAGPLIATPDAQCLRTMVCDYALVPHAGDWRSGRVTALAARYNTDLQVVSVDSHPGRLPDTAGFLALHDDGDQLKVTAIKRSEDGRAIIVRCHNPTDSPVRGRLASFFKIARAAYATLGEERKEEILVQDGQRLEILAPPKKIVTLAVEIERESRLPATVSEQVQVVPEENDRRDFAEFEPVVSVSIADIEGEERRAAELGRLLDDKQRPLDQFRREHPAPADSAGLLELNQRQLAVETVKRAYLEARLSAVLLRKKYAEIHIADTSSEDPALEEQALREIGLMLNATRVAKRALEYVVDSYRRRVARTRKPSGVGTSKTNSSG